MQLLLCENNNYRTVQVWLIDSLEGGWSQTCHTYKMSCQEVTNATLSSSKIGNMSVFKSHNSRQHPVHQELLHWNLKSSFAYILENTQKTLIYHGVTGQKLELHSTDGLHDGDEYYNDLWPSSPLTSWWRILQRPLTFMTFDFMKINATTTFDLWRRRPWNNRDKSMESQNKL